MNIYIIHDPRDLVHVNKLTLQAPYAAKIVSTYPPFPDNSSPQAEVTS